LELIERPGERGATVGGILQFDGGDGHAIDEDIGPPVRPALNDRELVGYEPVIVVRIVEIDQANATASDGAVWTIELDRHAFRQEFVNAAVFSDENGRLRVK
jgi:hypothetical protein